ncbi:MULTISPECIES: EutN/CcmL family microcompartment protein [Endozoicomonas]|uniref:Ethanolamine utilization protein EutN n=1 Tax=Endozoicomonas elysicola TaxID=305900 RepID=A0A081K5I9_9GAMM|nr:MULTISPECIES: EutN/CcmL family microcompartment protein [Endozoicomonas]KEI69415.1 ethanolamine utilization protein EutN [Endozoicomonas elysicola]
MLIGKVTGNIWATRKQDGLSGFKLMIVELINPSEQETGQSLVAVDTVGAGIGDIVLVARGGAARRAIRPSEGPVDEAIVGIVDNMEVSR